VENYDLGRVFSRLFQMVAKAFWPSAGFVAIATIALGGLVFLAFGSIFTALSNVISRGSASEPEVTAALLGAVSGVNKGLLAIAVIGMVLVSCILMTGVTDACLRVARGEPASFGSCLSVGFSKCLPVIGFYIIWYIGSLIAQYGAQALFGLILPQGAVSLISLIVSLFYYGLFAPSIPAIVNEQGVGPLKGFPRGLALISGHFGMIMVTLLLWVLIYFAAFLVAAIVMAVLGGVLFAVNKYLLFLLVIPGLLLMVALTLFTYGSMVTIYAELKLIKEGGDGKNFADVFS
jgi:hypothetical protein